MEDLRYHQNPKHRKTGIIMSLIFAVTGTFLMASADDFKTWKMRVGLILAVFAVFVIVRVIRNKVVVLVNREGIKPEQYQGHIIPWKYVEGFELAHTPTGMALVVKINDAESILLEMSGVVKWQMKTNLRKFGSPVVLTHQFFHKPMDEVVVELENYRLTQAPGEAKTASDPTEVI